MFQWPVRNELIRDMQNLPIAFFALIVSFFGFSCGNRQSADAVSVEELRKNLTRPDILVLDVRTPEELRGELGKLDGVVNIPVQELEQRIGELNAHKNKQLFVICRSGHRSKAAVKILTGQRIKAVSVDGGMKAWRKAFGNENR
jgi:rhodanese-related sulfurtransferase